MDIVQIQVRVFKSYTGEKVELSSSSGRSNHENYTSSEHKFLSLYSIPGSTVRCRRVGVFHVLLQLHT